MSSHRYPPGALAPDFGRTAVGLAVSLGPIAAVDLPLVVFAIFGTLAALFGAYGVQSWRRLRTRIEVTDEGIESTPFGAKLRWCELSAVRLGYFSVRRDRRDGWMELRLEAGRNTLRVDSRLERFDEIARLSAGAARSQALVLDQSTSQNLQALGISDDRGSRRCQEAFGDG